MKIAIGADHAGFEYKEQIIDFLKDKDFELKDFGCYSTERVDYPDYVHPVAKSIVNKDSEFGILVCGSGNGVNMTANKYKEIRSALCWNKEVAELARQHNDANVITIPARFVSIEEAIEMVVAFLSSDFEGGRHADRVRKITEGL